MKLHGAKSPGQLAKIAKMNRQTIEMAHSRDSMNPKTAATLGDALKINPGWILFGIGSFVLPSTPNVGQLLVLEGYDAPCVEATKLAEPPQTLPFPELYAYIKKAETRLSAGGGTEAEEGFESERFGFLKSWLRQKATSMSDEILFLIDVEGDSMLPTFASKDMVLVDKGVTELRAEGYFAIGEGNFINIKRLKREDDSIHIISDNLDKSMYPTRIVDGESLRIIGRVIWVGREIP